MNDMTINDDVTMSGEERALLAGRYRIVRQLGQGGMGSVWLAEDTVLDDHKVAIKMLPSILCQNQRAYRQLKKEALLAMKLVHTNIAAVRSFEENNGNPFIVEDFIEGKTLDAVLDEAGGTLDVERVLELLGPVASALDYAHQKGIIHRDIKPGNIIIAKDGTPAILDFGIAREAQESMTMVTGKLSSGTLMYMGPEQLKGAAPAAAQDIYSFSAMVYECLSGRPPFWRGQVEYQIINEPPPPLETQHDIRDAVMAGLAKDPAARPVTCQAVVLMSASTAPAVSTAAAAPVAASPTPVTDQQAVIAAERDGFEAAFHFFRFLLQFPWRFNEVNSVAESLTDEDIQNASVHDILEILRSGLGDAELGEFEALVSGYVQNMAESLDKVGSVDKYVELYPQLKSIVPSLAPTPPAITSMTEEIRLQLNRLREAHVSIVQIFAWIRDGYDRYASIMNRSSLWSPDSIRRATCFSDAQTDTDVSVDWDNWQTMPAKAYAENYARAIIAFRSACQSFTTWGEEAIERIVLSRQKDWNAMFANQEMILRALAGQGVDLKEAIRRSLELEREKATPDDFEAARQVYPLALEFMESCHLSASSLSAFKSHMEVILGPLEEAAESDGDAEVQANDEAAAENLAEAIFQIMGKGSGFDDYYVGASAIPRNKLLTALRDYGGDLLPDDVLALYDATIFGGGGDGFIIYLGGIRWKQLGCDPFMATWADIRSVITKSPNGSSVYINGIPIDVPPRGAAVFVEIFDQLRALLAVQE